MYLAVFYFYKQLKNFWRKFSCDVSLFLFLLLPNTSSLPLAKSPASAQHCRRQQWKLNGFGLFCHWNMYIWNKTLTNTCCTHRSRSLNSVMSFSPSFFSVVFFVSNCPKQNISVHKMTSAILQGKCSLLRFHLHVFLVSELHCDLCWLCGDSLCYHLS